MSIAVYRHPDGRGFLCRTPPFVHFVIAVFVCPTYATVASVKFSRCDVFVYSSGKSCRRKCRSGCRHLGRWCTGFHTVSLSCYSFTHSAFYDWIQKTVFFIVTNTKTKMILKTKKTLVYWLGLLSGDPRSLLCRPKWYKFLCCDYPRTTIFRFYRVTLCVSAVFAVARWPSVCLCVSLSRSCILSRRLKIGPIVKLLCRPITIILVFLTHGADPNSNGNPSQRGAKYKGLGKLCDFRLKLSSISEAVRDRAHGCYGTLIESHMRSVEWWHFQWPWRAPQSPRFQGHGIFEVEYLRDKVTIEL